LKRSCLFCRLLRAKAWPRVKRPLQRTSNPRCTRCLGEQRPAVSPGRCCAGHETLSFPAELVAPAVGAGRRPSCVLVRCTPAQPPCPPGSVPARLADTPRSLPAPLFSRAANWVALSQSASPRSPRDAGPCRRTGSVPPLRSRLALLLHVHAVLDPPGLSLRLLWFCEFFRTRVLPC
jgi:hypothetical protein